ncbi:MAG: hypothetical protein WBD25_21290, partial [Terriglobales bacterium]
MDMFAMKKFGVGLVYSRLATAVTVMSLMVSAASFANGQTPEKTAADHSAADHYYEPLPQETGTTGLELMLRRLQTTAR